MVANMGTMVGCIFARSGSKGLPNKNLLKIGGISLLGHSINVALEVGRISRVIVSTDSTEIADEAKRYGAEVPFIRPAELATDTSPEWLSWQHAINELASKGVFPETIVSLPTTSPLRTSNDVIRCIEEYERSGSDVVLAVSESTRNPYFNMVTREIDGKVNLVAGSGEPISRRQDAPKIFNVTTVCYVASTRYVLNSKSLFEGTVSSAIISAENSIDIDSALDFRIAEILLKDRIQKSIH